MNYQQLFEIGKNGWFDFDDIYNMAVEKYPNGTFLEIGSWQGMSAAYMLEKAKLEQNYINFYCLDTFEGDPLNENEQRILKGLGGSLRDIFTNNLSTLGYIENVDYKVIQEPSELGHAAFPDEFFDFIFIDGGHQYDQVCRDIDCWLPKVKKGGMIGGHDYDAGSVEKAVKEKFDTIQIINKSWLVNIGENNVE